ncbi:hypothetical protein [Variovorax sp. YR752]|uniref:hypothetical protein n=1 Tax=Variovorax sp. YR752 TaxID=1884383 RepID=UPI00313783A2
MNRSSLSTSLALAALLSSAAPPAFAQDGHTAYRAQVLGERIASVAHAPSTIARSTQTRVLAGHAGYLVYLGRSPEQAIAETRGRGEEPTWAAVPVAQARSIDGNEAHARYLGHLPLIEAARPAGLAQHEALTLR